MNGGAIAFGHPLDESTPVNIFDYHDLRFEFTLHRSPTDRDGSQRTAPSTREGTDSPVFDRAL